MARKPHTATTQVVVNKHALTRLALEGPKAQCEVYYREFRPVADRLGLTGEPFVTPLRGAGNYPNIHDVLPWLENVDETPAHAEDRKFLGRLVATLAVRCPELKAQLDKKK